MIYYGDEAGMWGGTDPDDRMPMVWPEVTYENRFFSQHWREPQHVVVGKMVHLAI